MIDTRSPIQYFTNNAWIFAQSWDHTPALRKGTDAFCHPLILPTLVDISLFFVLKDDFWYIQWKVFVNRTIKALGRDHSAFVWKHKATIVEVTVTIALCVKENALNIKIKAFSFY